MEKLCIFCIHFRWSKEDMWSMGSTLTGPMMSGGDAACDKKHLHEYPGTEADWRRIILTATKCADYEQVKV